MRRRAGARSSGAGLVTLTGCLTFGLILGALIAPTAQAGTRTTPIFTIGPTSGPPGTVVTVIGTGFGVETDVVFRFHDPVRHKTWLLGQTTTDANGEFSSIVTVPNHPTPGKNFIRANDRVSGIGLTNRFTVT
jgi:hypothetical protein